MSRPRKTVRPDEIAALLAVGLPKDEAAKRLGVSTSTLQRRVRELRAQHGPQWGRSLLDATDPPGVVADLDQGELSVEELHQLARNALQIVLRNAVTDPKSAVAAARVALALNPEERAEDRAVPDRADLLARVKAATASARRMRAEDTVAASEAG